MPQMNMPQPSSADIRRSFPQGMLVIHEAPATAQALVGQALLGQTLSVAGDYVCNIDTYDWGTVEAILKPSAVSGTFAPSIERMYANKVAVRDTTAGSNFSAGAAQTLTLTSLNGTIRCRIKFTVPGGGSLTFADTTPAAPTSVAEYNGQ